MNEDFDRKPFTEIFNEDVESSTMPDNKKEHYKKAKALSKKDFYYVKKHLDILVNA